MRTPKAKATRRRPSSQPAAAKLSNGKGLTYWSPQRFWPRSGRSPEPTRQPGSNTASSRMLSGSYSGPGVQASNSSGTTHFPISPRANPYFTNRVSFGSFLQSELGGHSLTLQLLNSFRLQLLHPLNRFTVRSNHATLIDQPSLETADRLTPPLVAKDGTAL